MNIALSDFLALVHPAIAVTIVFPLLGMVLYMALQTRIRRLQVKVGEKSRIPPTVGPEHLKLGRYFTGSVVGVGLISLAYSIFVKHSLWVKNLPQALLVGGIFGVTLASLVLLYRATQRHWRAIFATLTGMGLVILGCQDGVFRRTHEWWFSHYYYGMAVVLLMIFSLAIFPDIYQDRSGRWRVIHLILNSLALLLFIGQGITGARDLLDIPLSWQKPYIYQCKWEQQTCPFPIESPQSQTKVLPSANIKTHG